MSVSLSAWGTRAIVLDIEGTTTPVEFVYDVLFPFVRARVTPYLEEEWATDTCRAAVALLREEHAADVAHGEMPPALAPPTPASAKPVPPAFVAQDFSPAHTAAPVAQDFSPAHSLAAYVHWLMDRDRKSTGLKTLQGHIWQHGYRGGALRGQVFPDVPLALERWRAGGLPVCIYSSGSVLAQQLLFGTTAAGDLTKLLTAHFDTTVGPKTSPDSYHRIVEAIGVPAAEVLFVSDVTAELDAARAAGCRTVLCVRPSNVTTINEQKHPVIRTFDEIAG